MTFEAERVLLVKPRMVSYLVNVLPVQKNECRPAELLLCAGRGLDLQPISDEKRTGAQRREHHSRAKRCSIAPSQNSRRRVVARYVNIAIVNGQACLSRRLSSGSPLRSSSAGLPVCVVSSRVSYEDHTIAYRIDADFRPTVHVLRSNKVSIIVCTALRQGRHQQAI